ncbi:MAG: cysteine desulfurase family protein [Bdellovibrionota bacterium]
MGLELPVYLDNNSTTVVDPRVVEAMLPVFQKHYGNPASAHRTGWFADELVKVARGDVASLIQCGAEEIIFTGSATESNNLAILGFVRAKRKEDPGRRLHVISVVTEHRSVLDPLKSLEEEGVSVTLLPVFADGTLLAKDIETAIRPDTVLITIMLANNEIGAIHPVKEIGKIAARRKIVLHCDATQALGKMAVNVNELGADLISLSAHKIYGPKGIGALYIRQASMGAILTPLLLGGGHEKGYRAGTLNVPGIVGFGAAAKIVHKERSKDKVHMTDQTRALYNELKRAFPMMLLNGPQIENRLVGNLNLAFPGLESVKFLSEVAGKLSVSVGSACQSQSSTPSYVLQALGLDAARQRASIRIGVGRFTTSEEIQFAAKTIIEAVTKLSKSYA